MTATVRERLLADIQAAITTIKAAKSATEAKHASEIAEIEKRHAEAVAEEQEALKREYDAKVKKYEQDRENYLATKQRKESPTFGQEVSMLFWGSMKSVRLLEPTPVVAPQYAAIAKEKQEKLAETDGLNDAKLKTVWKFEELVLTDTDRATVTATIQQAHCATESMSDVDTLVKELEARQSFLEHSQALFEKLEEYLGQRRKEYWCFWNDSEVKRRTEFVKQCKDLVGNNDVSGLQKLLKDNNIGTFKGWSSQRLYDKLVDLRKFVKNDPYAIRVLEAERTAAFDAQAVAMPAGGLSP